MADLSKLAYQIYRKRIVSSTSAFIIIKSAGHLIDKMKKHYTTMKDRVIQLSGSYFSFHSNNPRNTAFALCCKPPRNWAELPLILTCVLSELALTSLANIADVMAVYPIKSRLYKASWKKTNKQTIISMGERCEAELIKYDLNNSALCP